MKEIASGMNHMPNQSKSLDFTALSLMRGYGPCWVNVYDLFFGIRQAGIRSRNSISGSSCRILSEATARLTLTVSK